jgi:hypothetical protein
LFTYRLILEDGSPLDPPQFVSAVPSWREGETFMIRPGRVYRIVEQRPADDAHAIWVVEPLVSG